MGSWHCRQYKMYFQIPLEDSSMVDSDILLWQKGICAGRCSIPIDRLLPLRPPPQFNMEYNSICWTLTKVDTLLDPWLNAKARPNYRLCNLHTDLPWTFTNNSKMFSHHSTVLKINFNLWINKLFPGAAVHHEIFTFDFQRASGIPRPLIFSLSARCQILAGF